MAKPVNNPAGTKKARHTPAQKKAARQAREKTARAQLKGRPTRRERGERWEDRGEQPGKDRWRERDAADPRGRGERAERRSTWQGRDERPRRDDRSDRGGYDRPRRDDRGDRGGFDRPRRDDRGDRGGFDRPRRDDRGDRGGFDRPRRDDRGDRGGYDRPRRDDRGDRGGFDRPRRDDRAPFGQQGGADRRGPARWEDREERGYRRRDDQREAFPRREHTFRAHREEREGRNPERGRHEGRSWDEDRRRRDDRWESRNRFERRDGFDRRERDLPRTGDDAFAEAEAERDEADAAYQARLTATRAEDATAQVTEDNGFAAMGLHEELVAALARIGITSPFPIQAATIPDALEGRDLLGRGQTGSGKTMAFGLPMLHRLATRPRAVPHRPRALILSPTRELAMQSVDALTPLMRAVDRRFVLVAGGMSYTPQMKALEKGVDVLLATPGRLIDLIDRGAVDLSEVEVTVLDEADHMAEMGFVEAITQILDLTPADGQRMLFSATLDHGVDRVAKSYLTDPVTHSTDDVSASVETMAHHVFLVHPHDKKAITAAIANRPGRTVVFCRTKLGADRIALQLRESGVFGAALHGGLNQAQRTRVLDAFKSGQLPVLVATDVAARGIHVDDVSLVLQVDPPADHKDYLHRSGRTARAGEDGVVVTLALPHQRRQVKRLLDQAGVETDPVEVRPEDTTVIETAGGSVPTAEPILQSQLDEILRPRRPQGRGGRRPGGRPGGSGGRYGDRREGGPRRDGGPRREGGRYGDRREGGPRRDDRPDWRPRG